MLTEKELKVSVAVISKSELFFVNYQIFVRSEKTFCEKHFGGVVPQIKKISLRILCMNEWKEAVHFHKKKL